MIWAQVSHHFSSDVGYYLMVFLVVGSAVVSAVTTYFICKSRMAEAESSRSFAWGERDRSENSRIAANKERDAAIAREKANTLELDIARRAIQNLEGSFKEVHIQLQSQKDRDDEIISVWRRKAGQLEKDLQEAHREIKILEEGRNILLEDVRYVKNDLCIVQRSNDALTEQIIETKKELGVTKQQLSAAEIAKTVAEEGQSHAATEALNLVRERDSLKGQCNKLIEQLREASNAFDRQRNVNEEMAIRKERELQEILDKFEQLKEKLETERDWLKDFQQKLDLFSQQKEALELKLLEKEDEEVMLMAENLFYQDYFGKAGQGAKEQWNAEVSQLHVQFQQRAWELRGKSGQANPLNKNPEDDCHSLLGS